MIAVTTERRRLAVSSMFCIAAIGGTRVERSAGLSTAISVTARPISTETITVRVATTSAVVGRPIPSASKSDSMPFANRRPPSTPRTAPSSPISAASMNTEVRTCLRDAPRVRSSPYSRIRCETVIEKVLKITKAPTISETAANTPRKIGRKLRASWISLEERLAFCSAVSTRSVGGTTRSIRAFSSSDDTSGLSPTEIWLNRPTLPVMNWASGRVSCAMLAPPNEVPPSSVRPTRR